MRTETGGAAGPSGTLLAGRYRLGARLGAGGMGEVFRAYDEVGRRDVAVKRVSTANAATAMRNRREVRALEALALPGVVRLIDEMEVDGWQYIVMELVHGTPFPGRVVPLAWDDLGPIAESLLETLARVHDAGVLHRDLKPDNVLIDDLGRPTILDFGLAKGQGLGTTITRSGMFAGTPAYAAPEQLRGEHPDARSDLFSLGLMVFSALTGELPDAVTDLERLVVMRLTRQLPPIRDIVPELPSHVALAVDRMVSLERNDRFDTAAEALSALRGGTTRRGARLPWLGGTALLDDLVSRVRAGHGARVGGAPGMGKTRLLHELAERLRADGVSVGMLPRGERPFESLRRWAGAPDLEASSLTHAVQVWTDQVGAWLDRGGVLLVDGLDQLDRYSRRVIEALPPTASLVVTVAPEGTDLVLRPWTAEVLHDLFHGPDVVLHLREDGAAELMARTQGIPARVDAEVGAWVRAGLARWDGDRLRVTRAELDALRSGVALSSSAVRSRVLDHALRPDQEEFLAWVALAGARGRLDVLGAAMSCDPFEAEALVEELQEVGALMAHDGLLILGVAARALQRWDTSRRALAHHALAHALEPGDPERLRHLVLAARWAERTQSGVVTGSVSGADTLDMASKVVQTLAGDPGAMGFRDEDAALAAQEAIVIAEARAFEGHVGAASAAIRLVLPLARDLARHADEARLLTTWAYIVLEEMTVEGLRTVVHDFARSRDAVALPERCLVEAALAALEGRGSDAMAMLEGVVEPSFRFQRARQLVRFRAVRYLSVDEEAALLEEVEAWAAGVGPLGAQTLASFRGLHRYRVGDFAGAAADHAASYPVDGRRIAQVGERLNEASAWLEAHALDQAERCAAEAFELARSGRHAFFEGRATWLLRSARYRREDELVADAVLVEAVAELGTPSLTGLAALTEAAIAWRATDRDLAAELAGVASESFRAVGQKLAVLVCDALRAACGAQGMDTASMWAQGMACPSPRVGLQVMGLLATATDVPEDALAVADGMLGRVEDRLRGARREVLSCEEGWALCRGVTA